MSLLPEPLLVLRRRTLRTVLAVVGVAAGVFAMELLGAVSAHFRQAGSGLESGFLHRVFVCERVSFWAGGGILSAAKVPQVASVPGVSRVIPMLVGRLDQDRLVVLGVPEVMVGVPPEQAPALWQTATLAAGQWFDPGGAPGVVLGAELAGRLSAHPGSTVTLLRRSLRVAGVLHPTGGLADRQALAPLVLVQDLLDRDGLLTDLVVEGDGVIDLETLGRRIEHAVHGVQVVTPSRLEAEVRQNVMVWDAIAAVLGLGATLAGGVTVAVTSLVSVQERTAEIAVRRALGATRSQIFGDVVAENLVVVLLGWGIGTAALAAFMALCGPELQRVGAAIFTITGGLVLGSLGATALVGLLAGALPAWVATRIDVVAALHHG